MMKDPWHIAPLDAFRAIVSMFGHGAEKHDGPGGDDWRRGRAWSDDWSALQRHLAAWWLGDGVDATSGRSHLWHAGARLAILIAAELRGLGTDDRPGAAAPVPAAAARTAPGLIYLATPYTHYPHGIVRAFEDASALAARLIQQGLRVYSPIAHTHPIAVHGGISPVDHEIWLPFDETMMAAADTLYVAEMAGWHRSRGIAHEIGVFERAGKPIYMLDPDTLVAWDRRDTSAVDLA